LFWLTILALHKEPEVTPLQLKLNRVANLIVKFGAITAALLFVALFIKFLVQLRGSTLDAGGKGQQFIQILIISLVILVIAVPEGLPLAVTLALAYATIRMLKDRNLVRVLKACETMGNATTVCSDKTGTLTQNRMTVVVGTLGVSDNFGTKQRQIAAETTSIDHESSNNIALRQVERQQTGPTPMRKFFLELPSEMRTLLRTSIAINSTAVEIRDPNGGKELVGSKTETALLELGKAYLGLDDLSTERSNHSIVQLFPFSSHRKCMGTVVKHRVERQTEYRLFVKGASEVLLNQSSRVVNFTPNDVSVSPLSKPGQEWIQNTIDEYSSQSLRTISLAYRDFRQWPPEIRKSTRDHYDVDFADVFEGMTWIGVMGIRDPLRPGVLKAVKDCQNAGVFVRMVTGDNVLTAKSVAIECGIFTAGGIIMEGPRFRTLSRTQRDQIIPRLQVLARSSPDDKRILVSCLKQLGDVVAVTGDGTNDGPALRMADVGFSMGLSGTEVAKEASSIILMDDDFGSIVKAIMWGRCVNDAVKKFLQVTILRALLTVFKFQLTVTVVAVVLSFVSSIAGNSEESVLSVVQLLWVNLIQDTFAALALATDPPSLVLLQRKPEPKSASIISVNMWKMIMGQSVIQLLITFFLNFAGPRIFTSWTTLEMKTVVFNTFSWLQIFNLINCRRIDNRLNVFTGIHRNWLFIGITLITVGGQVLIIFVGGTAFSITRLNGLQWATSILLGLLSLPFGALIRCIPNSYLESLSLPRFFRRKQRSTSIIESKLTAQVPRTAALEGAQHPTVEEQHERTSMGNSAQNEGPPTPVLDRYASSDSSRHGKYSRSDSTSIAAVREPVSVATSVMRSLSSRPTAVLEDQYPITNRRDLDRFRGIELHPETDPLDPVVGKGSAEFKFLEVRKQLQRREETRGKG
jgi:P-type Ca2+ transporter type 2C